MRLWRYLIIIIGVVFMQACRLNTIPVTTDDVAAGLPLLHARSLLLDARAFPERWQVDPCEPYCERAERPAQSYRTFGIVNVSGHVVQEVFVFKDAAGAQAKFQLYREADSRPLSPPNSTFTPPADIPYRSAIANEYYLVCGVDEKSACRAGLRYGNYFVYFFFDIVTDLSGGLQMTEVEPILRDMDARAAQVLGLALPTPTTGQP